MQAACAAAVAALLCSAALVSGQRVTFAAGTYLVRGPCGVAAGRAAPSAPLRSGWAGPHLSPAA